MPVDFDNDGDKDILAGGNAGIVYFFANTGGSFSATPTGAFNTGGGGITDLRIGDFNGDGITDFSTTHSSSNRVYIGLADGSGGLSAPLSSFATNGGGGGSTPKSITVGDFDGDGISDLFVTNTTGASQVYLGNVDPNSLSSSAVRSFFVEDVDLSNQIAARSSLTELQDRLTAINLERGSVGAFEQSVRTRIAALGTRVENFRSAEGRITDADVAEEAGILVRDAIAEEMASSVLAQANQAPQIVLGLIQNAA